MKPQYRAKHTLRQRGFALVVTLSLMILLTVVAVGLLSLSTVSLRASSQGQAAAEARANARLALMMAIGELQKELGPDSRITAPHDAGTTATGGQPNWTAVYDAWTKPANNAAESPASRVPKFRGWLASGANQANGGPAGTSDKATLVGDLSLPKDAPATDQIRVPMHALANDKGQRRGSVAWWTADESVKAKINAGPDVKGASTLGTSDPLFHAQSPPNIGHRAFPKLAKFDWKDGQRAITISTPLVNIATGLGTAGVGGLSHDFTVQSAGLLADVRAGRLKRDLSNLLARPITELEDKPLFLANGRINDFKINQEGGVSNSSVVGDNTAGSAREWGVNLEELGLYHNLHKQVTWSGGAPALRGKNTREACVKDRYFVYRKPTVDAVQFIFSLKPQAMGGGKYKMLMMLDGLVALSNPNDVPMVIPPGLDLPLQLLNIPYDLRWNIQKGDGTVFTPSANASQAVENFKSFMGHIESGAGGNNPAGFTLEPGESAVFGSSDAKGYDLNLKRGFNPSGGVEMTEWNLGAENLVMGDTLDFEFERISEPAYGNNFTYYNFWLGTKVGTTKGWQLDTANLAGAKDSISGNLLDQLVPPSIRPSEALKLESYFDGNGNPVPKPILMFSFLRNVEQSSGDASPDAFASRTLVLNDPALSGRVLRTADIEAIRHTHQSLITAQRMNYQFLTLAAGAGGRNVYHGGGRQLGLGNLNVISRRIPVAPPLSLGAFQNAIACGLVHINEDAMPQVGNDNLPNDAAALSPWIRSNASSIITSKVIGNSFCPPYLAPNQIYRPKSGSGNTVATKSASDYSWLANSALWDSWFLSGIVDGRGVSSSSWLKDKRSARAQFKDLAEGKGMLLRNKRYLYYPYKSSEAALKELFNGEDLKPAALIHLPKYLLVDGAFNVNSTSATAWEALLSSVRDQELLIDGGASQKFEHPFGTLGYAKNTATSGIEGDWSGLRDLKEDDVRKLANAIVTEVKSRGPFLSLADFVNRRPDGSDPVHQVLGALQAAINRSGLNDALAEGERKAASVDFDPLPGSGVIDKEPKAARAVGSPGYISQGDVLTAIGPQITVRGDTFIIRTYGDSRDPSGKIVARALCEAVVQRTPEYVDPADAPEAQDGWPNSSDKLAPANSLFGRRMMIRSFRWLNSGEVGDKA